MVWSACSYTCFKWSVHSRHICAHILQTLPSPRVSRGSGSSPLRRSMTVPRPSNTFARRSFDLPTPKSHGDDSNRMSLDMVRRTSMEFVRSTGAVAEKLRKKSSFVQVTRSCQLSCKHPCIYSMQLYSKFEFFSFSHFRTLLP